MGHLGVVSRDRVRDAAGDPMLLSHDAARATREETAQIRARWHLVAQLLTRVIALLHETITTGGESTLEDASQVSPPDSATFFDFESANGLVTLVNGILLDNARLALPYMLELLAMDFVSRRLYL